METPETQEPGGKEVRGGRPPKTVSFMAHLSVSDHETLARLGIKKMRQTGEDVTRDRVLSEAIQFYAKSFSGQE